MQFGFGGAGARKFGGGLPPRPFSVLDLDPTMWLRADREITLNETTVSAWGDLSGNSNNATQGTAASQPTFTASAIGGRPGVTFDGTDDFMAADGVSTIATGEDANFTLCVVMQVTSLGTRRALCGFGQDASGTPLIDFTQDGTDVWRYSSRDDAATNVAVTGGTVTVADFIHVISRAGTTLTWRVNGTAAIDGANIDTGTITLDNFTLGALNRGGTIENRSDATFGEYVAVDRTLDAAEIAQFEAYAASLYGITLA